MPETDRAIGVEHRIAAKLAEVPLARTPPPSPEEQTGVEPHRAKVQQANQPPPQTPRTIRLALWVNPDLEGPKPGLKRPCRHRRRGEGDDHNPGRPQLRLPLSQLRQVLLAGESTEIPQEYQDGWTAAQIFQAATLAGKIGEAESGGRQARADGHYRFQRIGRRSGMTHGWTVPTAGIFLDARR